LHRPTRVFDGTYIEIETRMERSRYTSCVLCLLLCFACGKHSKKETSAAGTESTSKSDSESKSPPNDTDEKSSPDKGSSAAREILNRKGTAKGKRYSGTYQLKLQKIEHDCTSPQSNPSQNVESADCTQNDGGFECKTKGELSGTLSGFVDEDGMFGLIAMGGVTPFVPQKNDRGDKQYASIAWNPDTFALVGKFSSDGTALAQIQFSGMKENEPEAECEVSETISFTREQSRSDETPPAPSGERDEAISEIKTEEDFYKQFEHTTVFETEPKIKNLCEHMVKQAAACQDRNVTLISKTLLTAMGAKDGDVHGAYFPTDLLEHPYTKKLLEGKTPEQKQAAKDVIVKIYGTAPYILIRGDMTDQSKALVVAHEYAHFLFDKKHAKLKAGVLPKQMPAMTPDLIRTSVDKEFEEATPISKHYQKKEVLLNHLSQVGGYYAKPTEEFAFYFEQATFRYLHPSESVQAFLVTSDSRDGDTPSIENYPLAIQGFFGILWRRADNLSQVASN
jgi:hypothetical protein